MARVDLAPKRFLLKLDEEQHAELKATAAREGMTMQAYVELKLFGRLRPRGAYGPRPYLKKQDEELPLTG